MAKSPTKITTRSVCMRGWWRRRDRERDGWMAERWVRMSENNGDIPISGWGWQEEKWRSDNKKKRRGKKMDERKILYYNTLHTGSRRGDIGCGKEWMADRRAATMIIITSCQSPQSQSRQPRTVVERGDTKNECNIYTFTTD